jgi:hypothetical protein
VTYDGFKSHVNVTEALEVFAENKIIVVKEESRSSDTNQAYDQLQAVADKCVTRQLLDIARTKVSGKMDQNKLVAVIAVAVKGLSGDLWKNSFIRVNLHPHFCLPFEKWIDFFLIRCKLVSQSIFAQMSILIMMPCLLCGREWRSSSVVSCLI